MKISNMRQWQAYKIEHCYRMMISIKFCTVTSFLYIWGSKSDEGLHTT